MEGVKRGQKQGRGALRQVEQSGVGSEEVTGGRSVEFCSLAHRKRGGKSLAAL